jgi:peroxiredoxin
VPRPRLLAISLLAALVVGGATGWFLADRNRDDTGHLDGNRLGASGADTVPVDGIPVATDVSGDPLPDIDTEALDGAAVPLRSLTGKPLVLNFWYSTCLPCRKEMPAFQEVHEDVGERVRFVGINPLDGAERAQAFADEVGVTYELLRDPDGRATAGLGIARFPTTVFVAADGTVLDAEPGELSADELRAQIEELYPA